MSAAAKLIEHHKLLRAKFFPANPVILPIKRPGKKQEPQVETFRYVYATPEDVGPHWLDTAEKPEEVAMVARKLSRTNRGRITLEVIRKHGVTLGMIRGPARSVRLTKPRHELCYRLRTETHMSYEEIGDWVNRDHSTVIHSARCYAKRYGMPL